VTNLRGVRIAGTGSYVPERVVTNDDLAKTLDTNDDWIRSRTGIRERRLARDDETASDMGAAACGRALEAAGKQASDVDLIVCATMTGDFVIPNTVALIAKKLGAENAMGFDLGSACSGFVHSLNAGAQYIKAGSAECVLVLGSEKMSYVVDWDDRGTAILFGDGAGAAVLVPDTEGASDLLALRGGMSGNSEVLSVPAGGSAMPTTATTVAEKQHLVKMNGREVYKFAVKTFTMLLTETCASAGVTPQDVAIVVPHQVNRRILEAASSRAGISMDRVFMNIENLGNTSGASVGLALDGAVRAGRVKRGDLVLMVAFGAGLAWASALVRW
jgi:3-oxoacyl-[acyl-carrier-protein] synthase III